VAGDLDAVSSLPAVKLFGITIWPQGMIPRHRDRLAQSDWQRRRNELVSQETVFEALLNRILQQQGSKLVTPTRMIAFHRLSFVG